MKLSSALLNCVLSNDCTVICIQGKTYCIWKMNNLQDLETSVSFFLFGQVYSRWWKTDIGSVIGILNPSIMDPFDKVMFQGKS